MRKILCSLLIFLGAFSCFSQTIQPSGPIIFCQGGSVVLTVNGTAGSPAFKWKLNGTDIPGATSISYTAVSGGSYTVELTGGTNPGVYGPTDITVNPKPVAAFTFTPNNSCGNMPVVFTGTPGGNGSGYSWDFGDPNSGSNNSSNNQNPIHRFKGNPGNNSQNFNVKLKVTNSFGCVDSVISIVTTNQLPDPSLGGTGATTYAGLPYFRQCGAMSALFNFTNLSSTPGTNANYRIEWGDASPAFSSPTFIVTNHTYSTGTYPLLFIVTGNNGCIDTSYYYVFVGSNPAVGLGNPGNTSICTGSSLTFPITGTSSNPPGTMYTVTFNDGTAPIVYVHPNIPSSITHTFNTTSCGTTSSDGSSSYTNSFSCRIVASNPCGTSAASIVPIYVSTKPAASFTVAPKDTVCVNTNVTLTNTSNNNYIDNNGQCTTGNPVWVISPATGWTITGGNLGNDFGLNDPSAWQPGSNVLSLNFTVPGTYTVKLKTGNPNCGVDSIVKTICVNPLPTATFTVDQNTGCAPLTVNTTTTTNTPICGIYHYNWTVTYVATSGCAPSTAGYSFLNGTDSTSAQPVFHFTNPGIYTIGLVVSGPACSAPLVTQQITVKSKPVVALNPLPAGICQNQSINPGASATCYIDSATTYAWSFPGGTPSTSTLANPGTIIYNTPGTYNISLSVTNECGTTTVSQQLLVNSVTTADAGPTQTTCGTSVTLTANAAVNGTGFWTMLSGPNNPLITNPSSPVTTVTGMIPGTYVFQWTITNGGCVSTSTVTITIVAGGTVADAGPDQGLCLATVASLAANTPVTGIGIWTLVSGPGTPVITTPTSPSTTVTGLIPGTYTFRWTISFGNCTPGTDDVQVTIYDNPTAPDAGPDQTICSSVATLAGNVPAIGTGLWINISGPNTPSITTPASPATTVTGLVAGTYLFEWTISSGNCPSNADTVQVTVTGTPTIAAAGPDQSLCSATMVTLAGNTPVTGTGAWTMTTGPNVPTITNPSAASTTVTGLIPGIYTFRWTIASGGCSASSDDVSITINDGVTTADAGLPQTTCGTSTTMTANAAVIGTGLWTMVSGPNNPVITNPSSPVTTVTGMIPGTYVFMWTITNGGCVSTASVTITIVAGGTVANAGPDQGLCLAMATSLAANTPVTGTGIWTLVSGPGSPVITTPSSTSTTVTGLVPGTYIFRWTISFNNCSPSNDDVQVTIYDNPDVAVAGPDQTICSPVGTLAANVPVTGTGLWTSISGPNTPSITTPASATTTVTGLVAGTYLFKWTISNGNCPSNQDTVSVTVTGTPTIAAAGPDQVLCSATTVTLAGNTPVTGIGSWTMTAGPNVPTITNSSSPLTTVTGLIPGIYTFRWTITGGACSASSDDITVTINDVTTADAGSPQVTCGTFITMAANTAVTGASSWTMLSGPNNPVITNPSSPVTTVTGTIPGTYVFKWTITNAGCVSSSTVTITILAGGTVANAGPDQGLCLATVASIAANTPVNGTGIWTLVSGPGTPVITTPSSPSTTVSGLIPGTYTFRWTISFGNCTPGTDDVQVTIYDNPDAAVAGPDQTICFPATTLAGNVPVTGTGLWTSISGPNTPSITTPASATTAVTGLVAGTYLFKWTISNGNCPSNQDTVSVTVTGTPTISAAGPDQTLCSTTTTATFAGNTPVTGTGLWTMTSGPNVPTIINPSSPLTTVTGLIPGVYTFRWTITSGTCSASNDDIIVTIKPPVINLIDTTTQAICAGQQVTVTGYLPTGGGGTYTYQWQQSFDGISFTDIAGAVNQQLVFTPAQTVFLRRYVSSPPCANYSDTAHIIVQAAISNNLISADAGICINTIAPAINGSLPTGGNNLYSIQWENSIDNGITWNVITGAVGQNYSPGILSQTTKYRRKISSGLCTVANTSNIVTISVNPNARAAYNPLDSIGCAPWLLDNTLLNVQAYPAQNGQYLWYVNNNLISTGLPFAGYTMPNNDDTIILKLKTISLYGCLDDSVSHRFITRKTSTPSFSISDSAGCGPLTIQFQNTTISANLYSYQWNFGNGQTSTAIQPGAVTFQQNPGYGDTTYIIRLKIISACDTSTVSRNVLVQSKPKALFTPGSTFGCSPFHVGFNNTSKGVNNTYYWDFGDGTSFTTTLTDTFSHVYNTGIRDTFYVSLKATNNCGSDSLRYAIIVTPNTIHLDFQVNGNEVFGCAPQTVHFINNSGGATTFSWNFGDGTTLNTTRNIDTVTHIFLQAGIYNVQVRATNACSDTVAFKTITVFGKPVANFIANKYFACTGDSIRFTNQSDSATSYLWQFGDGTISTLANPPHAYQQAGIYNVVLKSSKFYSSGNGCTDSITKQINIVSTLLGSYTMSDTAGTCAPLTVNFVNNNIPSVSAAWDFGDGTNGIGDVISHTFTSPGTFIIKLVVKVPGGCTYNSQRTVTVLGPSGSFQYTGGYVCNQQSVRFEATVNNTDSLTWDFGDGTTLTTIQKIVFHSYSYSGVYVPKVTLRSNQGCGLVFNGTDTIKVDKISAGFASSQQSLCGTSMVNFTDTSHAFFGISIHKWNFGDGTTGSGSPVLHNYSSAGNYNVQLVITGNSGCSDTLNKMVFVTVHNKPVAAIQGGTSGCTFSSSVFNAVVQSVDSINLISWTTSNGLTGNSNPFIATFAQPGSYTIRLVAGTVNGCLDTTFQTININPSPILIASGDVTICKGNTAQLSVTGAQQYAWSPGQGLSCTVCANPMANPLITTQYLVKATNSFGCSGSDTVVVTVMQPFLITVSGNDSICVNQSANLWASGATNYVWSPSAGLSSTNISNPVATPSSTTRYRVIGYDGSNCFTDTGYVTVAVGQYPAVNLGPDLTLATGTLYSFTPAIQNGPIRSWLWSPAENLNCTTCPLPVATIKKDISYFVTVKNNYGCAASDTINIKVFCENSQVFIPNAFSPDGDGINDMLTVRGKGIVTVKSFRIFNRWGELVFERINFRPNDPESGWDGKIKGVVGGPDVYVYTAEVVCESGVSFIYKGNTTIIK